VPVETLFDYLEAGKSINDLLQGFPSVTRDQVVVFLEQTKGPACSVGRVNVFLDECVDWRLSRDIDGHEVRTARQMDWTTIQNGELLSLASAHFDPSSR
jgi:hypothetical protein